MLLGCFLKYCDWKKCGGEFSGVMGSVPSCCSSLQPASFCRGLVGGERGELLPGENRSDYVKDKGEVSKGASLSLRLSANFGFCQTGLCW